MESSKAEKEYIEREAALNVVNGWRDQLIPTYGKNDEYVKCLETVAEHLELLHAANVRPVVLCRDCYWWKKQKDSIQGRCSLLSMYPTGNWFCANGQKRTKK